MIHHLSRLYPDSLLNPSKDKILDPENYYLVKTDMDKLYISKESLKSSEIELLDLLTKNKNNDSKSENPFERLLFEGVVDDLLTVKKVRFVYLQTNHLEIENFNIWKQTLMDSLIDVIDVVFISTILSVVVFNTHHLDKNLLADFSEVIQSLDQDFNLLTLGMIGQATNVNPQTKEIFEYEKELFLKFIDTHKIEGVTMLSDLLIHNVGAEFKKSSTQLPTLLSYLYEEQETQQLIYALFQNGGNLSQTANALYLHRNTLSYRIEQLYQKTGFDLMYLPDLIVCYLLII